MNKIKIITFLALIAFVIIPSLVFSQPPPPPPPPPDPDLVPINSNLALFLLVAVYYGSKRLGFASAE